MSKSNLCGRKLGMPCWPTLPKGIQPGQPRHPSNKLRARTNEDKGKDRFRVRMGYRQDGQGWVMGRMGMDRIMGKDGQGQLRARIKRSWMPTRLGQSWAGIPR